MCSSHPGNCDRFLELTEAEFPSLFVGDGGFFRHTTYLCITSRDPDRKCVVWVDPDGQRWLTDAGSMRSIRAPRAMDPDEFARLLAGFRATFG